MANRRNYKTRANKGLAIFCVILAFMIAIAFTLGGLQIWGEGKAKPSNWFKGESTAVVEEEENVKYETTLPQNGGMTLPDKVDENEEEAGEVKSNSIALMSTKIPVAQYAAYNVPSTAETAKTVTATVSPDNEAANTKIKWELSWKNPASAWATGKKVSDYVTLQSNADDLKESKTCTVSCSQAFGEQIQLKAICVEDETKFATCNVDYVRQVKSAGVSIGDVSVNLGGNTDITIAIRRDYGGKGGKVTVTPTYGDVYTIENVFTGTATLTTGEGQEFANTFDDPNRKYVYIQYGSQAALHIAAEKKDYTGESIYFDTRFFEQFNFSQFGIDKNGNRDASSASTGFILWKDFTANEIKNCYTNLHCQGKILFTMKVSLTSGSYEYSYESNLVWTAIDETVPLTDVQINDGQDMIFP